MEVTDIKAFIYAYGNMIWGDNVKVLEIRSAHWEGERRNYGLQINLEKTVTLRLSRKKEKAQ
jgi:hypothetical protein